MTMHTRKSKTKKQIQSIYTTNSIDINTNESNRSFHNDLNRFFDHIQAKKQDLSNRTLIIVPGYSVSNPPRIGDHRFYIDALKHHPDLNPNGYRRIYVFDLYSRKDGRCNFKHSIPQLANELYQSINTDRDNWQFSFNGAIDFIGASMGGLIVRKFIQDYLSESNKIQTNEWGKLQIRNVILIATPNHGCQIVDKLQMPLVQFILRLLYGKNNFSQSEQFKQIAKGKVNLNWKPLNNLFNKTTEENTFLADLNSKYSLPNSIRWITISGSKRRWYSSLIYNKKDENDGVVLASSVALRGAENITDKNLEMKLTWNHRDLYQAESVCKLLHGLLILNLKLDDYLTMNQLLETQNLLSYNQKGIKHFFNMIVLNPQHYLEH
ncbi:MAG: hypothetical protein FK733_09105 [Asgard group archaeon]|nr:hypothetical protein [Asgard group archaeon]